MRMGSPMASMPEYVLRFQPPLVIRNCLPFPLTLMLTDLKTVPADAPSFTLDVGASIDVHQFDMSRKVRMWVALQVGNLPVSASSNCAL